MDSTIFSTGLMKEPGILLAELSAEQYVFFVNMML